MHSAAVVDSARSAGPDEHPRRRHAHLVARRRTRRPFPAVSAHGRDDTGDGPRAERVA
ncbi:hypothetical protein [Umezawaea beigongshangensis]|uniref:hypothetical protein n=1 Tax=Umezawaea beigongshangensis TaxID=2780383 RepID=UPI0018F241B9|nr:hypothetical protein [Umezawaea beigongshangensis]